VRRLLAVAIALAFCAAALWAADDSGDTPRAAATRKLIKNARVTVEYKNTIFREVKEDLEEQVKGLKIMPDTRAGVQLNTKITYSGKDVPLEKVLAAICEKNGWGYYVISGEKNAYNGQLKITVGKERGYEKGKEPKDRAEPKDKAEPKGKPEPKEKPEPKGKPEPKDKAEPKGKPEPKEKPEVRPEDDTERAERMAATKLRAVKGLIEDGKPARAREVCEEIIRKYPKTKAAEEAKRLLRKL